MPEIEYYRLHLMLLEMLKNFLVIIVAYDCIWIYAYSLPLCYGKRGVVRRPWSVVCATHYSYFGLHFLPHLLDESESLEGVLGLGSK